MKQPPGEIGFPVTRQAAELRGYKWLGYGKCRGCGVTIDWYETPNGRRMPIDVDEVDFRPHFKTCPQADKFRKK